MIKIAQIMDYWKNIEFKNKNVLFFLLNKLRTTHILSEHLMAGLIWLTYRRDLTT